MMNGDQKYITLDTHEKIYYNERSSKQYLNRITVLYGASMSGKTTLMFDILHILKDKISVPIVFCPTTESESNTTYKFSFPACLIFQEVDLEKIEQIYSAQIERAKKYRIANLLNVLRKLFDHVSSDHDQRMSARIVNLFKKIISKIDASSHGFAIKKGLKKQASDTCDESLKNQWKDCIRKNRHKLKNIKLQENEKIGLKYMDFNPHLLLIFDDCAAQAKIWSKSPTMKKLFFRGRHEYITQIYTMQNDKLIPPNLRQNTHNSIFTDEFSANAFFAAKSNGISKDKQKLVRKIISDIFPLEGGINKYIKLIYSTYWHNPLTITIANEYDNVRMGSLYLWKYDKKLPRKNQTLYDLSDDKSYMQKFH
jgi:energy-coupling factor transporter ATP-binding protein EcfA2